jgi:hypothetical protein
MSIASYSELQAAVLSWLHRTDATDVETLAPDWIALAEARIYRELRVRQMETALSVAISSGAAAVPTGYIEMKYAYLDGTPTLKLERKDAEWIYQNYPTRSADGTPKFFARDASSFIFGPYPTDAYTLKGTYYKRLSALSGSNTTNWLTDDCPDLILWGSLCEAAPWVMEDERIALWEGKYQNAKQRVQRQSDDEEFSGSPLSSTVR